MRSIFGGQGRFVAVPVNLMRVIGAKLLTYSFWFLLIKKNTTIGGLQPDRLTVR